MWRLHRDRWLAVALWASAALAAALLVLVVGFVLREAAPALTAIGLPRFFTDAHWHPLEDQFNLRPMLLGTVWATLGAVVLAAPIGILCAAFCHYYAPSALARGFRRMIELLAGIPSVVYGFWGLVVLVPLIAQWQPPGASLLAGIVVLFLMILPTVTLIAESSFAALPREYLQAAVALGLGRFTTLMHVAIPAARSGLVTAVVLAAARALGETMAVLMVCGNVTQAPGSVFDAVRTLTANIALEMAYALGTHRSALFVSGLVLLMLVVLLVAIVTRTYRRVAHAH